MTLFSYIHALVSNEDVMSRESERLLNPSFRPSSVSGSITDRPLFGDTPSRRVSLIASTIDD